MKSLLKVPFIKPLLLSSQKCFALKKDRSPCGALALRGTRYRLRHQSKLPWIVVMITSIVLPTAKWEWSRYHPSEELRQLRKLAQGQVANLSIVEAKADIQGQARVIAGKWKNSGLQAARDVPFRVMVSDLQVSNVLVRFADSFDQIAAGAEDGFWAELPATTNFMPWPEMVLFVEAQYRSDHQAATQTDTWLGVLKKSPEESLGNVPAGFAAINADERHGYMTNLTRLLTTSRR